MSDSSSGFADEGTDAHELAALCLVSGDKAATHLGRVMGKGNTVGPEMSLAVQDYVDYVNDVVKAVDGVLLVEQRLPISMITGEDDSYGTSDVVILSAGELCVIDLKYGRGVAVDAIENPQLQIYGLAAYHEFSVVHDFDRVRMVIHQPRLGAVSEWSQSVDDLLAFGNEVTMAAATTRLADAPLHPSIDACRFCKAKANCRAIHAEVLGAFEAVQPEDADARHLAQAMAKADLIEGWLKAVRAEVERRLLDGHSVPGFKLVMGKRGNRAWSNAEEAEAWLKPRMKLDEMYDFKLVSPTTLSKRLEPWVDSNGVTREPVLGPRQQKQLQELITQKEGAPSVAHESDKRPALVRDAVTDFDDLS
jgi:hypothetical protein